MNQRWFQWIHFPFLFFLRNLFIYLERESAQRERRGRRKRIPSILWTEYEVPCQAWSHQWDHILNQNQKSVALPSESPPMNSLSANQLKYANSLVQIDDRCGWNVVLSHSGGNVWDYMSPCNIFLPEYVPVSDRA